MRPRVFTDRAAALRWSRCGGVALYAPAEGDGCLFGSALTDAAGWSLFWAGRSGVAMAEVEARGSVAQAVGLSPVQTAWLREQALAEPPPGSDAATVLFYSGTREGHTPEQQERLREFVYARRVTVGHHGCCVGGDEEFHALLYQMRDGGRVPWLVGWPARVAAELTCVLRVTLDDLKERDAPLQRNAAMALRARWELAQGKARVEFVACPADETEQTRGGTWHAVRKFRAAGVPSTVITPSGRALG